jgi:hypothetical protein
MRRLFVPAVLASIVLFVALSMSLFALLWTSRDGSSRIGLSQGCVHVWRGRAGDFGPERAGLRAYGWSADVLLWSAEFDTQAKVWVASTPAGTAPGAATKVRQIAGTSVMLPLLYPLLAAALLAASTFRPWRRHRRLLRGECPKCRYDQRGLTAPRCPECGAMLRGLWNAIRRRIRRWASSPTASAT